MPVLPSTIWLSREERRALVRARGQAPATPTAPTSRCCLYCYGALANGSPVCSDACDEGWWRIVPTRDGELYGAAPPEPEEPPERHALTPAERQRKRREKIKAERAALVSGLDALARA